jgi:hypothetical protein
MNYKLHRKQVFMLVLATILAVASYLIPLPQQSSHASAKPDSPDLRESAPSPSSGLALIKRWW